MRILLLLCLAVGIFGVEDTKAEDTKVDETTSEEQITLEAVYLGVNKDLSNDKESIVILQITNSERDDELANDAIVLCHWESKEGRAIELDQQYQIVLHKKNTPSAVSWVLVSAQAIELPTDVVSEPVLEEKPVVQTSISVSLLDDGMSWLLMSDEKQELHVGMAEIVIKDLAMSLKVEISANDGKFLIVNGAQLHLLRSSSGQLKNLQLHQ